MYNFAAMPDPVDLYRQLFRIRRFEETVLENFPKGLFFGTTHTYIGQEADAVGVLVHLQPQDFVFSNHRGHGHFLAYGGSPHALFAELMGRSTGVCGGRGGSQHLQWHNFYSNGVQGGIVPISVGMALAEKVKGSNAVGFVFIGDGTLGEGVVYEALNMASLWQVPLLIVLENNHIAQTTSTKLAVAGSIAARFESFGIPTQELDSSDVLEILPLAKIIIDKVRLEQSPRTLILHTCRFGPHSKGDDTRDPVEIAFLRKTRDPLRLLSSHLEQTQVAQIETAINAEIEAAFAQALVDPFPSLDAA